jgi:hypothetical protein
MMKAIAWLLVLFCVPVSARAGSVDESDAYQKTEKERVQFQDRLASVIQTKNPRGLEPFQEMNEAWVRLRETECSFRDTMPGSPGYSGSNCFDRLTSQRLADLKRIGEFYGLKVREDPDVSSDSWNNVIAVQQLCEAGRGNAEALQNLTHLNTGVLRSLVEDGSILVNPGNRYYPCAQQPPNREPASK